MPAAEWTYEPKAGSPWAYDAAGYLYDDPRLTYEGVGATTVWTNESKS